MSTLQHPVVRVRVALQGSWTPPVAICLKGLERRYLVTGKGLAEEELTGGGKRAAHELRPDFYKIII